MGRKSRNNATQATDLVNFHFSTPATSQPQSDVSSRRPSNNNSNQRNNRRRNNQQYNRTPQDRASARRKANSAMFYLHSSSDHAFTISRRSTSKVHSESYSFSGPDSPVSWESVSTVKQFVSLGSGSRVSEQPTCPICLCDFVCPRITKCGHSFCLPCILRHVQSYTANNSGQHVKCPCCGIPVFVNDLRPVVMQTFGFPAVQNRIKLIKLHRQRACPAPYLPLVDAPMHSSPHSAPTTNDPDAKYSRFNYVDPAVYHAALAVNQEELEQELKSVSSNGVESSFLVMSLELVRNQLQQAQFEQEEEKSLQQRFANSASGIYQPQSSGLVPPPTGLKSTGLLDNSFENLKLSPGRSSESSGPPDVHHCTTGGDLLISQVSAIESTTSCEAEDSPMSMQAQQSPSPETIKRYRGDSIGSYKSDSSSTQGTNKSKRAATKSRCAQPGSMYLDESTAVHFYQAEDGQLVFLNGFNMTCLLSDFSKLVPSEDDSMIRPPLPDYIEGNIAELEHVHLTPEVRKRMPFLSHLPLYTDLIVVEMDLNHILSDSTKKKFKEDIARRRKRRQSKMQAEKREDRVAKKEEAQRINDRKSRLQLIDPDDDFFRPVVVAPEPSLVGQDFGPTLVEVPNQEEIVQEPDANATEVGAAVSFSEACRQAANNQALTTSSLEAFPALGSSPLERPGQTSVHKWGNPLSQQTLEKKPGDAISEKKSPSGSKKRKGKGQKLVLFSTGGQRGPVY